MTYARIYAGPDGESHVEDVDVAFTPVHDYAQVECEAPVVHLSEAMPTVALTFLRLPPGTDAGWHPAPRRQFVTVLTGAVELTTSDGNVRQFGPGAVALAEDTTGKGHRTRAIDTTECLLLVNVLADGPR